MEFQYYVDPADSETPLFYHYLNGHPHYTFPSDFIMTGHVHILPYTPWAPKVRPDFSGQLNMIFSSLMPMPAQCTRNNICGQHMQAHV